MMGWNGSYNENKELLEGLGPHTGKESSEDKKRAIRFFAEENKRSASVQYFRSKLIYQKKYF